MRQSGTDGKQGSKALPLIVAGLITLSGCAAAPPLARTRVVVVPAESDGHVGAVRVSGGGGELLADQAYLEVSTDGESPPRAEKITAESIATRFATIRAARPEAPASFTLYFNSGKDVLTENSERELPKVIAELSRRPGADIVLIGHTDRVGSVQDNDALSLRRAQTMARILESRGVAAAVVQAAGRGEREPLVPTADEVAEPRNRRVEVTVR